MHRKCPSASQIWTRSSPPAGSGLRTNKGVPAGTTSRWEQRPMRKVHLSETSGGRAEARTWFGRSKEKSDPQSHVSTRTALHTTPGARLRSCRTHCARTRAWASNMSHVLAQKGRRRISSAGVELAVSQSVSSRGTRTRPADGKCSKGVTGQPAPARVTSAFKTTSG